MAESEPKLFRIQGDVYEVEKLVAVKIVKGRKLFRVRWRGYGRESDTLEPEENLLSCKDMIDDLEQKIQERHGRKRGRRGPGEGTSSEGPTEDSDTPKTPTDVTWQASEVSTSEDGLNKDTFWRDFDEGKISGISVNKDMYSKVKERASRAVGEPSPKCPSPPLCPKVVLKRKSADVPTYKSTLQKPMHVVKKKKRYDVLRDYRKRRNRFHHRKKKLDENGRRKLLFRNAEGGNILQELLINDKQKKYMAAKTSSEMEDGEELLDSGDGKMNQLLMCRISMQDNTAAYPTLRKKEERPSSSRRALCALLEAVAEDRQERVERLCGLSATLVNARRHDDGATPLMVAAQTGRYYVAKILLKANAHKDKQNKKGETALMLACKNGHSKVAKLLLEHGANFALTNAEGINVLRIANRFVSQTVTQSILIEHIVRVVSAFECEARSQVRSVAQIKHALFPIQCFSLNEGTECGTLFHHHATLESPEKIGNQNLLFIARITIRSSSTRCQFDTESIVQDVYINGVKQELFSESISSVFKVSGLQNGSNKVIIVTGHHPESEVKLVVCAYKVQKAAMCFPTQKIKNDF